MSTSFTILPPLSKRYCPDSTPKLTNRTGRVASSGWRNASIPKSSKNWVLESLGGRRLVQGDKVSTIPKLQLLLRILSLVSRYCHRSSNDSYSADKGFEKVVSTRKLGSCVDYRAFETSDECKETFSGFVNCCASPWCCCCDSTFVWKKSLLDVSLKRVRGNVAYDKARCLQRCGCVQWTQSNWRLWMEYTLSRYLCTFP